MANENDMKTSTAVGLSGTESPVKSPVGVPALSPMGWFYIVEAHPNGGNPSVYRCKLGQAWERMEVYDIGEVTPAELRFIADVIDASKAAA